MSKERRYSIYIWFYINLYLFMIIYAVFFANVVWNHPVFVAPWPTQDDHFVYIVWAPQLGKMMETLKMEVLGGEVSTWEIWELWRGIFQHVVFEYRCPKKDGETCRSWSSDLDLLDISGSLSAQSIGGAWQKHDHKWQVIQVNDSPHLQLAWLYYDKKKLDIYRTAMNCWDDLNSEGIY